MAEVSDQNTSVLGQPNPSPAVWKVAPGENARKWDEWREQNIVSVGWTEFGNLAEINKQDEFDKLAKDYIESTPGCDWKVSGSRQVWRFAKEIRIGDIVIANKGTQKILGIGRVTGDYEFVEGNEYAHQRAVEWFDVSPKR